MSDTGEPTAEAMDLAAQPAAGAPDGVVRALLRLCSAAVGALSASGAAVSVMAEDGGRGVAAASDPASERIEELQFILGEGPCIDAFASRRPVLVPDLTDGTTNRWPAYTSGAQDEGVRAVFAFPLCLRKEVIGALNVFGAEIGGGFDDGDVQIIQRSPTSPRSGCCRNGPSAALKFSPSSSRVR